MGVADKAWIIETIELRVTNYLASLTRGHIGMQTGDWRTRVAIKVAVPKVLMLSDKRRM